VNAFEPRCPTVAPPPRAPVFSLAPHATWGLRIAPYRASVGGDKSMPRATRQRPRGRTRR
jgi:hypothetical protein